MKHSASTRSAAAVAVALSLALTACGSGGGGDEGTGDSAASASGAGSEDASGTGETLEGLSGTVIGAGASSQRSAQVGWQRGFLAVEPRVLVSYDPVGSGAGREQFAAGETAFAGSDSAWELAEDGPVADNGVCAAGSGIVQVPLYVSPVAVAFNLDGVDALDLSPAVIAGIFAERITTWNDPAIVASNPGVALPDAPITTVYRADESGTTGVFTSYLAAAAPEVWTYGTTEIAPGNLSPEVAQGTSGVIATIEARPGSIGYADASQVGELGSVAVGVGGGFEPFSPGAAAALVDASPAVAEPIDEYDLAIDVDYATAEAGVYPIALVSYSIACERYEDPTTGELVKAYLSYLASPEGQEAAAAEAGNAPISDALRSRAMAAINAIS